MFEALKLFVAKELIATGFIVLEEYTTTILVLVHYEVRGIDTESLIGVVLTITMMSFHVWASASAERFIFTALSTLD